MTELDFGKFKLWLRLVRWRKVAKPFGSEGISKRDSDRKESQKIFSHRQGSFGRLGIWEIRPSMM